MPLVRFVPSWVLARFHHFINVFAVMIGVNNVTAHSCPPALPHQGMNLHDLEAGMDHATCSSPIDICKATHRESMYANDGEDMDLDDGTDYLYDEDNEMDQESQPTFENLGDLGDLEPESEEEDYPIVTHHQHSPSSYQFDNDPRFFTWTRTTVLPPIVQHAREVFRDVCRRRGRPIFEEPLRIRVLRQLRTPEEVHEYQVFSSHFSGWNFTRRRKTSPGRRRDFSSHENDFEY